MQHFITRTSISDSEFCVNNNYDFKYIYTSLYDRGYIILYIIYIIVYYGCCGASGGGGGGGVCVCVCV